MGRRAEIPRCGQWSINRNKRAPGTALPVRQPQWADKAVQRRRLQAGGPTGELARQRPAHLYKEVVACEDGLRRPVAAHDVQRYVCHPRPKPACTMSNRKGDAQFPTGFAVSSGTSGSKLPTSTPKGWLGLPDESWAVRQLSVDISGCEGRAAHGDNSTRTVTSSTRGASHWPPSKRFPVSHPTGARPFHRRAMCDHTLPKTRLRLHRKHEHGRAGEDSLPVGHVGSRWECRRNHRHDRTAAAAQGIPNWCGVAGTAVSLPQRRIRCGCQQLA